jgi:hypothetical protein
MEAWLDVAAQLKDCSFVVDQIDLEEQPDQVAKSLSARMMFDDEQAGQIATMFKTLRPEDSGGKVRSRMSLSGCGWTLAQRKAFMRICGAVSEEFGYTTDQTYRAQSPNSTAP